MPVFDDYQGHRWDRYFTENFRRSHLRPHEQLPVGGHKEARERARLGNVGHNTRAQQGRPAYSSSIIFDLEPAGRVRQVLRLMEEVASRNDSGFYLENGRGPHETDLAYRVVTTEPGSRQTLALGRVRYAVIRLEDGRWIINHYDGLATE